MKLTGEIVNRQTPSAPLMAFRKLCLMEGDYKTTTDNEEDTNNNESNNDNIFGNKNGR